MFPPAIQQIVLGLVAAGGVVSTGCAAADPTGSSPAPTSRAAQERWVADCGGVCRGPREARVAAAAARLSPALDRPVRAVALATDAVCAFAWRDGTVYVTAALVDRLDDEELAAAVAHELGHLLADGRLRPVVALDGGLTGADPTATASHTSKSVAAAANATGHSSSVDVESRADRAGMTVLRAAAIDPSAMSRMLRTVRRSAPLPPAGLAALDERIRRLANAF